MFTHVLMRGGRGGRGGCRLRGLSAFSSSPPPEHQSWSLHYNVRVHISTWWIDFNLCEYLSQSFPWLYSLLEHGHSDIYDYMYQWMCNMVTYTYFYRYLVAMLEDSVREFSLLSLVSTFCAISYLCFPCHNIQFHGALLVKSLVTTSRSSTIYQVVARSIAAPDVPRPNTLTHPTTNLPEPN